MVIKPKNNVAPEAKDFGEYEKVENDTFLVGVIKEVKYDPAYSQTYQGETKVFEAVKIVFMLDGYKMPHSTYWMKLSYHKKSKLFTILKDLVENAEPFMDFDVALLEGFRVKTMWETNEAGYQNLVKVKPEGEKLSAWVK